MDYFGEPTGKLPPYLEGDTFFPGVYFPRWQLFDFCQNSTFKRRIESCVDCSEAEIMNVVRH